MLRLSSRLTTVRRFGIRTMAFDKEKGSREQLEQAEADGAKTSLTTVPGPTRRER